jgi:GH43 family beta-xylosidase
MLTKTSLSNVFLILLIFFLPTCKDESKDQQPTPDHEGQFRNPVLTNAPDPWVFQKGEWYYLMHTTGNSLRLYRTKKMSDLNSADAKTVWVPPATGMNSRNIWAPEIHFIDDTWYIYYAADDGNNANHRIWVLENQSEDPFVGQWTDRGELQLPDDKWAIDGTVFSWQDQLYFMWSGWAGDSDVRQDIYIAAMEDPLTVNGPRILQGSPPGVNEGPQFIHHDSKMHIVYSASGCWTDAYALGLLSADVNANILSPTSWTKSQTPLFQTNASGQAYSPGHNSFFTSPDGKEDWIVYHANNSGGLGCSNERSLRIQRFTWSNDDLPVFGSPVALTTWQDVPSGEN